MYNDIVWRERGNRIVLRILSTLEIMLENSRKDVGHFWGLDARRNGAENPYSETGRRTGQDRWKHDAQLCWERTSKIWCHQFFGKGRIRMQRSKKEVSIHFDGMKKPLNWFFALTISVNHLSIYGAVADLRREFARDAPSTRDTWCETTSRNSQNLLKGRNCRSYAVTLVSWIFG